MIMHKMNLWNDSFEAIKDGWETIEIGYMLDSILLIKIWMK